MGIRTRISSIRTKLARSIQRGPHWARALYFAVASEPFEREKTSVNAGITRFLESSDETTEIFELRRAIHMIEKGLTMNPRRITFATSYIERTIDLYSDLAKNSDVSVREEFGWMTAVLDGYFEATKASKSVDIARARREYQLNRVRPVASAQGPHPAGPVEHENVYESLQSIVEGRRSVRWFNNTPVDRAVVDRAVQIAMESPTACNRQPYRFLIFDEPEAVHAVASVPMGTAGYEHQLRGVIVVVGDLSAFFDERDRHLIYIDSSLATMGLILGLESQGVSTCCINWPDIPAKDVRMRELIGLRSFEKVVMLVAYGYRDEHGLVPFSQKKPLDLAREYRKVVR
jgi:nitroreductase